MRSAYSRLRKTEERKNLRSALVFTVLTIASILGIIFFGLPLVAKYAIFFSGFKKNKEPQSKFDITPPPPPRIDSIPEATNINKIEISGSSEAGTTVLLVLNGKKEEFLTNKEGRFTFSYILKEGVNTISASAKDLNGNESLKSEDILITFDNSSPNLEIESPKDGEIFYGSRNSQIVIKGKSEKTAAVFVNEKFASVDDEGNFSFSTSLSEGENTFTIRAEDKAQNKTEKSLTLNLVI